MNCFEHLSEVGAKIHDVQNKLAKIRRMSPKYLFPSFNTIAGSGKNGAIVHYRARKNNTKLLKRKSSNFFIMKQIFVGSSKMFNVYNTLVLPLTPTRQRGGAEP